MIKQHSEYQFEYLLKKMMENDAQTQPQQNQTQQAQPQQAQQQQINQTSPLASKANDPQFKKTIAAASTGAAGALACLKYLDSAFHIDSWNSAANTLSKSIGEAASSQTGFMATLMNGIKTVLSKALSWVAGLATKITKLVPALNTTIIEGAPYTYGSVLCIALVGAAVGTVLYKIYKVVMRKKKPTQTNESYIINKYKDLYIALHECDLMFNELSLLTEAPNPVQRLLGIPPKHPKRHGPPPPQHPRGRPGPPPPPPHHGRPGPPPPPPHHGRPGPPPPPPQDRRAPKPKHKSSKPKQNTNTKNPVSNNDVKQQNIKNVKQNNAPKPVEPQQPKAQTVSQTNATVDAKPTTVSQQTAAKPAVSEPTPAKPATPKQTAPKPPASKPSAPKAPANSAAPKAADSFIDKVSANLQKMWDNAGKFCKDNPVLVGVIGVSLAGVACWYGIKKYKEYKNRSIGAVFESTTNKYKRY